MSITGKELQEAIDRLPEERRESIYIKLHKAGMLINNVECELMNTELYRHSLFSAKERAATLWSEIFRITDMFEPEPKI